MKTLEAVLTESLIEESFGSKELGQVLMAGGSILNDRWAQSMHLQWDKVKDNDLIKVSEDEARKLYRKMKDQHYLIWVAKPNHGHETPYCPLITWGTDRVSNEYMGKIESTAQAISNWDWEYVYDVKDFEKFLQRNIHREREAAKKDALALKKADEVAKENRTRYEQALAKMRTPDFEGVAKTFEDAMNAYQECVKNWVTKYTSMFIDASQPTTWKFAKWYNKLTEEVNDMISEMESYKTAATLSKYEPRYAKEHYDKIVKCIQKLTEVGTAMEQSANGE